MSQFPNRAALWLNKLAPDAPLMSGLCPSVRRCCSNQGTIPQFGDLIS